MRTALYAATIGLAAFEVIVLWFALHPSVPANYRAYYIDRTTTCLDQPVPGTYSGGLVSFLYDGRQAARPLKVCGWEGPAGDGTHAVGSSSRLSFTPAKQIEDAVLVLKMRAIGRDGMPDQVVTVSFDGKSLADLEVTSESELVYEIPLGRNVGPDDGPLEVELGFPKALRMGQTDPSTRWRSIKLTAAGLLPGKNAGD